MTSTILRQDRDLVTGLRELADVGAWSHDLVSRRFDATPHARWLFGIPEDAEEISLPELLDSVHPDDRAAAAAVVEHAAADRSERYVHELRVIGADGRARTVVVGASVRRDDAGRPERLFGVVRDVTAIGVTGSAVENAHSLLDAVLEGTADGILAVGNGDRLLAYNQRFLDIYDLPEGAMADVPTLLHLVASRLANPEDLLGVVRRAAANPAWEVDDRVLLADGRIVERRARTLRVDGRAEGRVWNVRDVTPEVRAQEQVVAAANRLFEAERIAQVGSWEWDVESDAATWSPQLFEIFGRDPATFQPTSESASEPVHPDDLERWREALTLAGTSLAGVEVEYRIDRPDGEERIVHLRAEPTEVRDGRPVRVVGTVLDVTDRRHAERALAAAQERFRRTFEDAPIGMAVVDHERRVVEVNRALCDIVGREAGEIVALGASGLIHPDDADIDADRRVALLAGELPGYTVEKRYIHGSGEERWSAQSVAALRDDSGAVEGFMVQFQDITARRRAEQLLERHGQYDELTGLPRRPLLEDRIERALGRAETAGRNVALVYLDVDRLSAVNDAVGYGGGDALLVELSGRMQSVLEAGESVARVAGGEFAVLCEDVEHERAAVAVADRILRATSGVVDFDGEPLVINVSAGVALAHGGGGTPDDLLREATTGMHRAKLLGGARIELADRDAQRRVGERLRLESRMRRALDAREFELFYQPIVAFDGDLHAVEALMRWRDADVGVVAPSDFIMVAEETGLILDLGRWALRQACSQAASWHDTGMVGDDFRVAVNVSARQLTDGRFTGFVEDALRESGLPARGLVLEITETALLDLATRSEIVLHELRELGVDTVLDDFGEGYSSLSYLRRLPVGGLKIDRSFVSGIASDPQSLRFAEAIAAMGNAVGVEVVAEGVETKEQLEAVREIGCHAAQGFLLARPLAPDALLARLQQSGGRWPMPNGGPDDHGGELLSLNAVAALLGVSPSTARRFADSGRLACTRTAAGHRRFTLPDVEALRQQMTPEPALRLLEPPTERLPVVARALTQRPEVLLDFIARQLYHDPSDGWFGSAAGRESGDTWLRALGAACAVADTRAMEAATDRHLRSAQRAGATLLERSTFLERAASVTTAAVAEAPGGREELPGLRRLFGWLRQAHLREA